MSTFYTEGMVLSKPRDPRGRGHELVAVEKVKCGKTAPVVFYYIYRIVTV
jgi:hypothetical protein